MPNPDATEVQEEAARRENDDPSIPHPAEIGTTGVGKSGAEFSSASRRNEAVRLINLERRAWFRKKDSDAL